LQPIQVFENHVPEFILERFITTSTADNVVHELTGEDNFFLTAFSERERNNHDELRPGEVD
jgi:hypothetical protein